MIVRSGLGLALWLVLADAVSAQGFLERLEKQLGDAINQARPPAVENGVRPGAENGVAPEGSGYLGLIGDDQAEQGRGVRVLSVRAGSPAEIAGLRTGDLVAAINGKAITSLDDMERFLVRSRAGERLDLKIERDGRHETVRVVLSRRGEQFGEGNPAAAAPGNALPPPNNLGGESVLVPGGGAASLGITVIPVTDELRGRYGLSVRQGALVSAIRPGSAADQAGLPIGGVIVAAEGHRIERPDDLIALIRSMKPGQELMLSYYQGNTLFRKTVRLGVAGGEAAVPTEGAIEGDRPVLRRLEKALDGVVPRGLPGGIPFAPQENPAELKQEIETLKARVAELEQRLLLLEKKAGIEVAPPGAPLELPPPK